MSAILCPWIRHWSWLLCCLAAIMRQSILGPLNCNVTKTNKSLHYPVNCRPSPGNIKGGATVFGSGLLESTLLLLLTQRSNQTGHANHVWLWCSRLERPLKSATPETIAHIWHICEVSFMYSFCHFGRGEDQLVKSSEAEHYAKSQLCETTSHGAWVLFFLEYLGMSHNQVHQQLILLEVKTIEIE
jgi:hypothetical protein